MFVAAPDRLTVIILGSGTSQGVPMIGCPCPVCHSNDPRDRRTRCSLYLATPTVRLLLDTPPDLREQALREGLDRVDAVLYSHAHADHLMGFDDLRRFCEIQQVPLPIYGSAATLQQIERTFPYAFNPTKIVPGYVHVIPHVRETSFRLGELAITPLPVPHGSITTQGYLFSQGERKLLAYLSDCAAIPAAVNACLLGVDTLILDGLRSKPHPTHLNISGAIAAARAINPRRTFLTHQTHEKTFQERQAELPAGIDQCYDGLKLEFPLVDADRPARALAPIQASLPTALLWGILLVLALLAPARAQDQAQNQESTAEAFARRADLAAHLLVVYNRNDPESASLARYYSERRQIAPDRVLGLACSGQEEIARPLYEQTVHQPLLASLLGRHWLRQQPMRALVQGQVYPILGAIQNEIWEMVLIRGIPLKIAPDPTRTTALEPAAPFQTTAAAVDSELATLPLSGLPLGGYLPNPLFDASSTGAIGPSRLGPDLARQLILVTRLDAPTPAIVRRMIDDGLDAEQSRLAGLAVIDSRGLVDRADPYREGDVWLRQARAALVAERWDVCFDEQPGLIPASEPLRQIALYLGWYSSAPVGPWFTPPVRFVPGAIACHIHSFSASTLRGTGGWVGPLLAHGAAASLGAVYEPYLDLTPHLDVFTRHLLAGETLAEAAYASEKALSWMITIVGDPLYRPFAKSLAAALADAPPGDAHDWLATQAGIAPTASSGSSKSSGAVAFEAAGDLLASPASSATLESWTRADLDWQAAGAQFTAPIDKIRVGLKLAQLAEREGRTDLAQAEYQRLRATYADAADWGVPAPESPPTVTAFASTLLATPRAAEYTPLPATPLAKERSP